MATFIDIFNKTANASSAFSAVTAKVTALVRTRNMPRGISGYVFNVVESYNVTMTSKITPYPVSISKQGEAGSTTGGSQGSVTKAPGADPQPETITVNGLVGEISTTLPTLSEWGDMKGLGKYSEWVAPSVRTLDPVMAFVPHFAANARKYYNEAERVVRVIDKVAKQAKSLWDMYDNWSTDGNFEGSAEGQLPQNRQIEAFDFFRFLWASAQLVTVETAWKIYKNMAIDTITVRQDSSSSYSSFSIKFTQLKIVEPAVMTVSGRAKALKKDYTEKAATSGVKVEPKKILAENLPDFTLFPIIP